MAPKNKRPGPSTPAAPVLTRKGVRRTPIEAQRRSALPPVRVTIEEHDEVRAKAKAMGVAMGELIRRAVLGSKVQGVPAVNREIWGKLGPLVANLNFYAREVRKGRASGVPVAMIEQLRDDVDDLREYLLGRDPQQPWGSEPDDAPPPPARKPKPAAAKAAPKARRGSPRSSPAAKAPKPRAGAAKRPVRR